MHKFAREAYELGVHYIGGCCGFQVEMEEMDNCFQIKSLLLKTMLKF